MHTFSFKKMLLQNILYYNYISKHVLHILPLLCPVFAILLVNLYQA
jgi:hypothetical protein